MPRLSVVLVVHGEQEHVRRGLGEPLEHAGRRWEIAGVDEPHVLAAGQL